LISTNRKKKKDPPTNPQQGKELKGEQRNGMGEKKTVEAMPKESFTGKRNVNWRQGNRERVMRGDKNTWVHINQEGTRPLVKEKELVKNAHHF